MTLSVAEVSQTCIYILLESSVTGKAASAIMFSRMAYDEIIVLASALAARTGSINTLPGLPNQCIRTENPIKHPLKLFTRVEQGMPFEGYRALKMPNCLVR